MEQVKTFIKDPFCIFFLAILTYKLTAVPKIRRLDDMARKIPKYPIKRLLTIITALKICSLIINNDGGPS